MRSLKASLVCGALAASLATFLFTFGLVEWLDGVFPWGTGAAVAPGWTHWLAAAVLSFCLGWTTVDIGPLALKLGVAGVALVETVALSRLLAFFGIGWLPGTALLAGGLAALFGLLYGFSAAGRRKALVEALFASRVSAAKLRGLIDSDEPLPLAGERREASVVVCAIFNHDVLAEALPPAQYTALANEWAAAAAGALTRAGGTLEACGGERVRALFGLPLREENHAARACAAALELAKALEEFCREAVRRWNAAPDCRIAVNTGEMIAAAYGAGALAAFSATGETLEFARKLCLANTFYGSRILLGPRAYVLASAGVEVRPMELVPVRGQSAPAEIYELLAPAGALSPEEDERRKQFWRGVILFRERRWEEAARLFEAMARHEGCEDAPARFYLERIAHAREGRQALAWEAMP